MENFEEKERLAFELNRSDFYRAFCERNFDDMSDIYNEMTRYNDKEVSEGENTCFFTEILDGYKIKFPIIAAGIIRTFGQYFYYALKEDCITYTINDYPPKSEKDNIIFVDFKKESLEAARVKIIGDMISCTPKAVKTLDLAVGDIVQIRICNESFYIEKYDNLFLENTF